MTKIFTSVIFSKLFEFESGAIDIFESFDGWRSKFLYFVSSLIKLFIVGSLVGAILSELFEFETSTVGIFKMFGFSARFSMCAVKFLFEYVLVTVGCTTGSLPASKNFEDFESNSSCFNLIFLDSMDD